ncbi:MAG: PDZ domain-containing protein [Planctomycetes bacterium]|nr:PDZ domain-containing protein [Planctomycetota bacterium]
MKAVSNKLITTAGQCLFILVVILILQNIQSGMIPVVKDKIDISKTDVNLSVIDSVMSEFDHIIEKTRSCCVTIGGDQGVIISPDGYVLTNYTGKAKKYTLVHEGKSYDCKIVGWDTVGNIALYKIATDSVLPYVELSKSKFHIGESVFSIGNTMNILNEQVEARSGRIALERHYVSGCSEAILFDMNINDGFEGSGLFNSKGRLIGVILGYIGDKEGHFSTKNAFGYAMPIESILRFVQVWLQQEGICHHGTIDGLEIAKSFSSDSANIINIVPKSQADSLGFKISDRITAIDDKIVRNFFDFWSILGTYPANWTVLVKFQRDKKEHEVKVKLVQALKTNASELSFRPRIPTIPEVSTSSTEKADEKKAAFLGISTDRNLDKKVEGVPVFKVVENSPAATAGIIKGDIILTINGLAMYDFAAIEDFLNTHHAGTEVNIEILRGKDRLTLKAILAERK